MPGTDMHEGGGERGCGYVAAGLCSCIMPGTDMHEGGGERGCGYVVKDILELTNGLALTHSDVLTTFLRERTRL